MVVNYLMEMWENHILLSAVTAWFIAQFVKTIIHGMLNHEWRFERMWGSGGMPSSHSATVCALVVATSYNYGPTSFEFTIACLFAIIVIHDARGVRLETGRQAEIINDIVQYFRTKEPHMPLPEKELKELVGHTPIQVGAGMIIGILTGIFLH